MCGVGKEKTRLSPFGLGRKNVPIKCFFCLALDDKTLLVLLHQWIADVVKMLARGLQRVRRHG